MTHRIISIRLLFVFLSLNIIIGAQNISSIKIEGADHFSQSDYFKWINIPANSKLFDSIKDTIIDRIKTGLTGSGYYNAEIENINISQIDSSSSEIAVSVNENNPTFINKINFNCPVDSIYISEIFGDLQNKIFCRYLKSS